jgi:hypothetical protein
LLFLEEPAVCQNHFPQTGNESKVWPQEAVANLFLNVTPDTLFEGVSVSINLGNDLPQILIGAGLLQFNDPRAMVTVIPKQIDAFIPVISSLPERHLIANQSNLCLSQVRMVNGKAADEIEVIADPCFPAVLGGDASMHLADFEV